MPLSYRRIISLAISVATFSSAVWPQSPPALGDTPKDEPYHLLDLELRKSPLASEALGSYFDAATGEQVIVLPADADVHAVEEQMHQMRSPRRIQQIEFTREAKAQLRRQIMTRQFHPDASRYSFAAYFDVKSGREVVITNAPEHITSWLVRDYPGMIELRVGGIRETARSSDVNPYSGAALYRSWYTGGQCTAAWMVNKNNPSNYYPGTVYRPTGLLTAGHCYPVVSNVSYPEAEMTAAGTGNQVFGNRFHRSIDPDYGFIWRWYNNSAKFLNTYQPSVWTTQTVKRAVYGGRNPKLGIPQYCRSGAFSGDVCDLNFISADAVYVDEHGITRHGMVYTSSVAAQLGDSGAPIYAYSEDGVGVHVRAIHVASSTDGSVYLAVSYDNAMQGSILVCNRPSGQPCYVDPNDGRL